MSASLKLCKWFGLWNESNLSRPCWQTVFVIFCLLFWYILPGYLYIARGEKTLQTLLKPIIEIFAMSVITIRCIYHIFNRKNLQECFVDLQEAISAFKNCPYEDVRRTLKHLHKSAHYVVKIYVSIVFIQASAYGVVPAALITYQYCTSDEMIQLPSAVMDAEWVSMHSLYVTWSNLLIHASYVLFDQVRTLPGKCTKPSAGIMVLYLHSSNVLFAVCRQHGMTHPQCCVQRGS